MKILYVGDYGFVMGFVSDISLAAMTAVRMVIQKPIGAPDVYDFTSGQFTGVSAGGTLSYTVRSTDITVPGLYKFQVFAKNGTSDLGFNPLVVEAVPRPLADVWA